MAGTLARPIDLEWFSGPIDQRDLWLVLTGGFAGDGQLLGHSRMPIDVDGFEARFCERCTESGFIARSR